MEKENDSVLNLLSQKKVNIEKCPKSDTLEAETSAIKMDFKREPSLLKSYQDILSEIEFILEDDEEKALSQLSIEKAEKAIDTLSFKISEIITTEVINEANIESHNPLIVQETNKSRQTMFRHIAEELSPKELSERYPFIKTFDYGDFTINALSLETEKMLDCYYSKCSELLTKKDNVKALREFSQDMLSDEFEIFLEDIARF